MTYASRVELPSRRPGYTVPIEYRGSTWLVTVGLDPNGTAREVFIDTPLPWAEWSSLFNDLAITTSKLLQRGERVGELRTVLSERQPSFQAIVIALAEEIEREFGPGIAALYAVSKAAIAAVAEKERRQGSDAV